MGRMGICFTSVATSWWGEACCLLLCFPTGTCVLCCTWCRFEFWLFDLLWLITWSISWVGWQIYRLSIHGCFHKINVILVHIWKVFTVLLFVTKVLGTCTCTWLKKYLMYLMLSKYCEYLYLQIWKVLVLDSSTSESTWPQPCQVLVRCTCWKLE